MKKNLPQKIILLILLLGCGMWLFRYQLSWGPYYTIVDIIVTDTLKSSPAGQLMFGNHEFMAGGFSGDAVNIGVTVVIPDSAIQEFQKHIKRDPKYYFVDSTGTTYYKGPKIVDPPPYFVKIPVRSRLPKRSMFQKYAFHFTMFPHDSVGLEILLLDKKDCSHIPKLAATAYLGSGPCSF